jgi:hypothetical protein
LPAIAVALLIAGCGGGGGSTSVGTTPDERAAAHTVADWLGALVDGDDERACSQLTPSLRDAIDRHIRIRAEPGTCRQWAAKWIGYRKPPGHRDAHVTAVTVAGSVATATVRAAPDLESRVRLRKVGGVWRIDNY